MWDYCTRRDVKEYSGLSEDRLQDGWSEMVEDIIDEYVGRTFKSTSTYTEYHDGDGTDTVFLKHYPVVSVTSLAVEDTTVTATEYKVYSEGYIRLVHSLDTDVKEALGDSGATFPVGQKNITVVYTAGSTAVPGNVRLAAILMITQLALISERAGADGSLSIGLAGGTATGETDQQTWKMDVSGRMRRILRSLIGEKWKFA